MSPDAVQPLDDACFTCSELGEQNEGECPESKRPCGHHCNHSWDQDHCCWCDEEFGEEDEAPQDYGQSAWVDRILGESK